MVVKNHSGIISRIRTWENSKREFELKTYSENQFLWHFCQDDSTVELEKDRFYCPVYTKSEQGRQIRKSQHLFYVLLPNNDSGDCVFVEIGPDGFVNRTYQKTKRLEADIREGDLLPMRVVSTFGNPPEETIDLLKKYQQ
jgi:hypothetical protein